MADAICNKAPKMDPSCKNETDQNANQSSTTQYRLPVAKPLFFDFQKYGECFCWKVTDRGHIIAVPMATEIALIEPPSWFPSIPGTDNPDTQWREAVEGVFEVANIMESLQPSKPIQEAYALCVRNMAEALSDILSTEDEGAYHRDAVIQLCESTTYELEALVGAMQIFCNKQLTDIPGTLRVGVFMNIPWYPFDRNYNLNFVMTRWMRLNWCYPYPSHADMCQLTRLYNFETDVVLSWLENARFMVWKPLVSPRFLERLGLHIRKHTDERGGMASHGEHHSPLPMNMLPLGWLLNS